MDELELIDRFIDVLADRSLDGRAGARLRDFGIPVWALIGQWQAVEGDIDTVAHDYQIPREAVEAALAYYRRNKKYIDARLLLNTAQVARFYLDNDVSLGLVPLLELRGHTAESARGLGLTAAGDHAQLIEALERQAILLTYNRKDFELLHDAWRTWPPALGLEMPPHPGILALAHAPVREQVHAIDMLFLNETDETLRNELLFWSRVAGWRRRIVGRAWSQQS